MKASGRTKTIFSPFLGIIRLITNLQAFASLTASVFVLVSPRGRKIDRFKSRQLMINLQNYNCKRKLSNWNENNNEFRGTRGILVLYGNALNRSWTTRGADDGSAGLSTTSFLHSSQERNPRAPRRLARRCLARRRRRRRRRSWLVGRRSPQPKDASKAVVVSFLSRSPMMSRMEFLRFCRNGNFHRISRQKNITQEF